MFNPEALRGPLNSFLQPHAPEMLQLVQQPHKPQDTSTAANTHVSFSLCLIWHIKERSLEGARDSDVLSTPQWERISPLFFVIFPFFYFFHDLCWLL